jgi:hypothetical protein
MAKGEKPSETPEERKQRCVDTICAAISTSDRGVKRLCEALRADDETFPPARTIRAWIDEDETFKAQYARAKEAQADHIFDQIIEIADDDSQDELFIGGDDASGASAKRVLNSEFLQRSKLKVDARKWVVSKLLPKKYGDRITQEHTGEGGGPVQTITRIELVPLGDDPS